MCFAIHTKGNKFYDLLNASLDKKPLGTGVYSYREQIQFFSFIEVPNKMEDKFFLVRITVKILNIGTCMSEQTV